MDTSITPLLIKIANNLERIAGVLEDKQRQRKYQPMNRSGNPELDALLDKHLRDAHGQFTMNEILVMIGKDGAAMPERRAIGFALSRYGAKQRRTNTQRYYILP